MDSVELISFDLFAIRESDECLQVVMQDENGFSELGVIKKEQWLQ